jgi:hypothetical protein
VEFLKLSGKIASKKINHLVKILLRAMFLKTDRTTYKIPSDNFNLMLLILQRNVEIDIIPC